MANGNKPHAVCGAKKRDGTPCQSRPMPNGRCRMHGGTVGKGHGAPAGNKNARTSGIFSGSLTPYGKTVLAQVEELPAEKLAREAANFAVAKVAEAFGGSVEVKGIVGLVETYLEGLVQEEAISFEAKEFLMRRLTEPDISMLGKALAPLKGLLETKKRKDVENQASALEALAGVIERSQRRRDEEG